MSLTADMAGWTHTEIANIGPLQAGDVTEPIKIARWFSPLGLATAGAGSLGINGPIVPFHLALTLCIQRESRSEQISVSIDAIDVQAILGE